jgi:pyrroline-5-carboxylate reductase
MAGTSIKKLADISGHKKIIRMMPNLGLSVGEGIAAWKGVGLSSGELKKAQNFINKITENFEVKNEDTINKVTAISASGPAYFFLLADSLMNACRKLGLKKSESEKLVQKTLSASAILGKEANYTELIKRVKSKGGTTEAALKVFQKKNFNGIVSEAVNSAYKRAKELNK